MRVISGTCRGRQLRGPRGLGLRPTGDRLKETLFDILAPRLAQSVFVDGFAGTGAIGIEALSRGAREVVFIDSSREGIALLRQNLGICGLAEGFRVMQQDIFPALRSLGRLGFRADLIFLDPPYDWGPYRDLLDTLCSSSLVGPASLAVLEHHRRAAIPESGPGYRCVRRVRQGDQCLSFYAALDGPSGSPPLRAAHEDL